MLVIIKKCAINKKNRTNLRNILNFLVTNQLVGRLDLDLGIQLINPLPPSVAIWLPFKQCYSYVS